MITIFEFNFKKRMSHFTSIKTCFQNLVYLEKALKRLNITYKQEEKQIDNKSHMDLIITQANEYDAKFTWNGKEYEFVVDISFWEQSYPLESFFNLMSQNYAGETVIGESQKIGFQPMKYHQNPDGSSTLILERWSN